MTFKNVKSKTIECIKEGCYEHEPRKYDVNIKNLFSIGEVSEEEVIDLAIEIY